MHIRTSCQTETIDGGKWVKLQRITVEGNGMGKIYKNRKGNREKGCVRGTGCWGEIIQIRNETGCLHPPDDAVSLEFCLMCLRV